MTENDPLPDHGDDDELELEPIDPEILAHERKLAEEKTRQAESAVDIDEVYREADASDPFTWDDVRSIRFTTRHLLIATALISVVLTLTQVLECMGLFLVGAISLAAGWYFVLSKERRERLERARHREEVEQRIAAGRGEDIGVGTMTPGSDDAELQEAVAPAFRFSFSMKEMFGALTVAAVLFALVRGLGGADNAALLLGMIALTGLVVHLIGLDPPAVVVLGWWILLVLYIIVSIWAAFSPDPVAWIDGGSGIIMGVLTG